MNSFTVEPATPDILRDLYALYPDPAEVDRLLATYRGRVERGEVSLTDTLILRTSRGVKGTVMFGPAPHPYVFPHLRADAPDAAVTAFLLDLRTRLSGTPERQLVLDSARADVPGAAVLAAGWVLDDVQLHYRTELTAGTHATDSAVRPVDVAQPDVLSALAELDRADLTLRDGWTLHGLYADGVLLALGAWGDSGRPGPVREAGIDLIGVRPAVRGHGIGSRLHAHLLGAAGERYARHVGTTSADNHAMRRVFGRSGSVHTGTQRYYRQP